MSEMDGSVRGGRISNTARFDAASQPGKPKPSKDHARAQRPWKLGHERHPVWSEAMRLERRSRKAARDVAALKKPWQRQPSERCHKRAEQPWQDKETWKEVQGRKVVEKKGGARKFEYEKNGKKSTAWESCKWTEAVDDEGTARGKKQGKGFIEREPSEQNVPGTLQSSGVTQSSPMVPMKRRGIVMHWSATTNAPSAKNSNPKQNSRPAQRYSPSVRKFRRS